MKQHKPNLIHNLQVSIGFKDCSRNRLIWCLEQFAQNFEESTLERTFLAIKPDGVQRKLVGEIIRRFETKGFTLVGLKFMNVSRELAEAHYGVHKEKPFFAGLVEFITSGPVVAMVWEGDGVVASARKIIGATNPLNAEPGTIRGDFGVNIGRNIIHGSDAVETGQTEISLWFKEEELVSWEPTLMTWICE